MKEKGTSRFLVFGLLLVTVAADECTSVAGGASVLDGADVVAYRKLPPGSPPVMGRQSHYESYEGYVFRFVDAVNAALFKSNPEHYVPQWGAFDSIAISTDSSWAAHHLGPRADPNYWAIVDDKLHVFLGCSSYNTFVNGDVGANGEHNGEGLDARIGAGQVKWQSIGSGYSAHQWPRFNTQCWRDGNTHDDDSSVACVYPVGTHFLVTGEPVDVPSPVPSKAQPSRAPARALLPIAPTPLPTTGDGGSSSLPESEQEGGGTSKAWAAEEALFGALALVAIVASLGMLSEWLKRLSRKNKKARQEASRRALIGPGGSSGGGADGGSSSTGNDMSDNEDDEGTQGEMWHHGEGPRNRAGFGGRPKKGLLGETNLEKGAEKVVELVDLGGFEEKPQLI